MRSKYDVNVNEIAAIFGGGGHIKASGFTSSLPYEEIVEKCWKNYNFSNFFYSVKYFLFNNFNFFIKTTNF